MRRIAILAVFCALAGSVPPSYSAQIFEIPVDPLKRIDPSARSQAMGGAFGAVFWGDPDGWANPAVLGLARGIRYDDETTDFGLRYDARRTTLGWGGLGLQMAGRPFDGMGGLRYHAHVEVISPGETFSFEIDERMKSWGIGLSVAELANTYARARGKQPPAFARYVDLAAGFAHSRYHSNSFVDDAAEAEAFDWGLLVRSGPTFQAGGTDLEVAAAYGFAVQNANEGRVSGPFGGTLGNAWPWNRHGTSLRIAVDPPVIERRRASLHLEPLLSVGGAWDRVFATSGGRRVDDRTYLGGEIGLANVVFIRFGRPNENVKASGYGFALPIGRLARARYDRARLTFDGSETSTTDGWSVWIDPLAIAESLRRN